MPHPHSTPEEMFAYWKQLAGDDSPREWQRENLGMYFQQFRPHGAGVEAVFAGVVGAEELLPRLLEVYEATAEGGEHDFYFIVRQPRALSAERATELCQDHLGEIARIAGKFEAEEGDAAYDLVRLLDPLPTVRVVKGECPWPPDDDDPESLIYEVSCDFMRYLEFELTPVESHAHLLDEALYSLACDPYVKYHILWPLYRHLTEMSEPFESYFELWKHGAGYRFDEQGGVAVYVPNFAA
jgi:hypothetical protein